MNEKAMIRNWYYQITHLIQNTKKKWKLFSQFLSECSAQEFEPSL